MAINLAAKFESKTSDLVKAKRKTKGMTNNDWDWDGTNAINVYTLVDPTMGTYDPTAAANRYGTPSEVQDTVQNWALTRDRSWTKVMDKKNIQDTMKVRQPGKYLAQATKNVLVPEMDAYMLSTLGAAATTYGRTTGTGTALTTASGIASGVTTSSNAYSNLTALTANITDNEAPEEGRIAAMTATYYNLLKQGNFVLASDSAYGDRKTGNLGTVDNCEIVIVPSSRMPASTDLIISHPSVMVAPEKLVDYTLHQNPPGYSGSLLEYRHRYDAFVDANTQYSIAVHKTA
jgi:hypothetical protein